MLQSRLFTRTRREDPKDEQAKNAKLLIRAGFIHKEAAGIYSLLPLGLRVIKKIEAIIREEMNALGGQELSLSALQSAEPWQASGRWSEEVVDVWFKTKLKEGGELGLGFTHEEPLTALLRNHLSSHKDLPVYLYQFQTKFRNELRAKSGMMRGREFLMKDLYSFHRDQADLDRFYEQAQGAYRRIFDRVGLGEKTVMTFASGGVFAPYSHEFQTICPAGEDQIYFDRAKNIAVNEEVLRAEVLAELGLERPRLEEMRAVEVGNIFQLGTRFSEALGLSFTDEQGESRPVVMGSYGIGVGRLLGTIAEVLSDERGLVWPLSVAPCAVQIVLLNQEDPTLAETQTATEKICREAGLDCLIDDRALSAGEKFADADLLGLPLRLVVSTKARAAGGVEVKRRTETKTAIVPLPAIKEWLGEQK